MMNDILNAAKKYAEGLSNVEVRRVQWAEKYKLLTEHLKEIADYLNKNAPFKPGYFVDTFYAFDEAINGTCVEMPSVTFRSGDLPMDILFKNEDGNQVAYFEKGFQITFNPTPTGQIVVLLFPHHNNFHKEQAGFTPLLVINNLDDLTMNLIDEIVHKGMEVAFYSSFVGMAEHNDRPDNPAPPQAYAPIGFKRFESTEKK